MSRISNLALTDIFRIPQSEFDAGDGGAEFRRISNVVSNVESGGLSSGVCLLIPQSAIRTPHLK